MTDILHAVPTWAAFWGLCGGLLFGATGLVTAYSAKVGNDIARRKAWLHLGLGVVAGPILAEALTPSILTLAPAFDMRFVAVVLGWVGGSDPRGLFTLAKTMIFRVLGAPQGEQR